jgi:hypothetical protein
MTEHDLSAASFPSAEMVRGLNKISYFSAYLNTPLP